MDGFYPPSQIPQQEHQQRIAQSENQESSEQPPRHMAISIHDQTSAPHIQLQLQHAQSAALYNHLMPDQNDLSAGDLDEMQRRRSLPQVFGHPMAPLPPAHRRMSSIAANEMMTFGDSNDFVDYHFNQQVAPPFQAINTGLGTMQAQMADYMPDPANFAAISPDMMGSFMSSRFANMDMGQMTTDAAVMDLFPPGTVPGDDPVGVAVSIADQFDPNQLVAVTNAFSMIHPAESQLDAGPGHNADNVRPMDDQDEDMTNVAPQAFAAAADQSVHQLSQLPHVPQLPHQHTHPSSLDHASSMETEHDSFAPNMPPSLSGAVSTIDSALSPRKGPYSSHPTLPGSSDATTPATAATPREQSKEKAIYSKSGFDMLKALWLVATRKNPKINLGAVDMSCAFVVCDVTMNDCPIIYVSDNFQNLTGYSRHEIVGQNCRFLQAPDGKVEAGARREFVDDGAVYNLKSMIQDGREVQQSLINYRKGGKPFLNLLTMIPIPWDTDDIRYFIGFQIDLVECPDAISGQEMGSVKVNYKHSDIGQYIWTPPSSSQWEPENGQTLGVDDVSTLLQQFNPNGVVSDWHKQSWDKMLLENSDDVVHVLSLKGLFLYLSPSCKRVLEYDAADLVGNSLSSVCHPSDIVPVTRELKDATADNQVNIVFRIRRKQSGYTWFESHGSLFIEQGKGRKCVILVGRKRPVFALSRSSIEANGGIGDSELWTKLSTSGMFLSVSSNVRSLLDLQPENLVGTSIQDLMRKESRADFGRAIEKARRGKISTCKHDVQNRRGQGLQAQTVLYPGDTAEGQKPSFLLAQTKLLKASSRNGAPAPFTAGANKTTVGPSQSDLFTQGAVTAAASAAVASSGPMAQPVGSAPGIGTQDIALASEDNVFDELRTTKCSSWQFELRQMEKINRILAEELASLLSNKKKRKRRKGVGNLVRDCANCHTRNTPEWRRGPSGQRDLCNSCGLRWAKQTGRVSPRNSTRGGHNGNGDVQSKKSVSPIRSPSSSKMQSPNSGAFVGNGEGSSVDAIQLAMPGLTAAGGSAPAAGLHALSINLPQNQSSLMSGAVCPSMASIQEERELCQQQQLDPGDPPF